MRALLFSAALSTALIAGTCAQAQEAGVFDKWLGRRVDHLRARSTSSRRCRR